MFTRVKFETIQAQYVSMHLASSGIYTQVRLKPQIQNLGLRDQIFTSHDCPSENFNFVYNVMMMDDCF